jgi:hypothetical protein
MNQLHERFHSAQTAFREVIRRTGDPKLPGTLFGQALDQLEQLNHDALEANRPVAARLLQEGVDAWISRPDFPTVGELENMTDWIKQAHALIHDDDPHDPAELQSVEHA